MSVKRKNIRILTIILALVLIVSLAVLPFAKTTTFSDVPATHWAYKAIEYMSEKGIISGYGDGTFGPSDNMSYAQYFTLLTKCFYPDEGTKYSGKWWEPGMMVARDHNLLNGTRVENSYVGNAWDYVALSQDMTRYDMAQITDNYMYQAGINPKGFEVFGISDKIADYAGIPTQYRNAVVDIYAKGLTHGVDNIGTFSGSTYFTRAQAALMLYQMLEQNGMISGAGETENPTDPVVPEEPTPSNPTEPSTETGKYDNANYTAPATGYLTNGKPITEENIQEMLEELKLEFPEGMKWDESDEFNYYSDTAYQATGAIQGACGGFAFRIWDRLFGNDTAVNPSTTHQDFSKLKVGDVVYMKNSAKGIEHYYIVIGFTEKEFAGTFVLRGEGNGGGVVRWSVEDRIDGPVFRNYAESGESEIYTRW